METIIDIRSDVWSRPTIRMREAMFRLSDINNKFACESEINEEFQQKCAKLFGKEAALFLPSTTMGNLIAIMIHCDKRDTKVICGESSHIFLHETGSQQIAGVTLIPIQNETDGTFSLNTFREKVRENIETETKPALAIVENTHNICGGKVIPLDWIDELATFCISHGIKMHMDGARVFNAATYQNVSVSQIARYFDSIIFNLNKCLGAMVGSVLVGSKDFIQKARCMRKAFGGHMGHSGFLAAAALIGLEEIMSHINDDHRHTRQIAEAIFNLKSPFVTIDIDSVQTNIGMIQMLQPNTYSANYLEKRLQTITTQELLDGVVDDTGHGIIIKTCKKYTNGKNRIRFVIYHNINDDITNIVIRKITYCIAEMSYSDIFDEMSEQKS